MVVVGHTFESFYWPENAFDRPYRILNYPYFRLILHGGFLAVTIFFIMSGYVCSIKPLKLMRSGKGDEARKVIVSSAFRRIIRLGAPSITATAISWLMDRFGAFNLAQTLPGHVWLRVFSPPEDVTFTASLRPLLFSFLRTWYYDGRPFTTSRNIYEGIQWTMAVELHGSFIIYLALAVTSTFTPFYRIASFFALIAYSAYCDDDVLANVPFYIGAILADLSLVLSSNQSPPSGPWGKGLGGLLRKHWPIILAVFSLFIGSYPPDSPELSSWSRCLRDIGSRIFPEECCAPNLIR